MRIRLFLILIEMMCVGLKVLGFGLFVGCLRCIDDWRLRIKKLFGLFVV